MKSTGIKKLNICIIAAMFALILAVFSTGAFAASVPDASGQINSSNGVILRKSSSTSSAKICVLSDNTKITIHKEVFKSKTSTAKKYKWYYTHSSGLSTRGT
jgi:hypothetical protein